MNIIKKHLDNLQFYPTVNEKKQIFLHHTAGTNAQGALDWWNQTPDHVGTAYVIDRDGTIIEAFPADRWAYHIGLKGDDDFVEKNSIGIEIVSAGGLVKEGEKFMFYPLYPNKAGGREIPASDVWEMPTGWKGFKYFHKYTDQQVRATIELVKYLIETFKIQLQPDLNKFWEYNEEVFKSHSTGLWSHSTARKDKADIIPFPGFTKSLIEAIQTKPTLKVDKVEKVELPTKPNTKKK